MFVYVQTQSNGKPFRLKKKKKKKGEKIPV